MVNVSSLPQAGQSVFDLDTQAGVTHLLASIRASELSTDNKNELRDLVFLYANGGKDARVRVTLEQKIDVYKLPAAPRKISKSAPVEQPTIGKYRSAPSFVVAQAATPATPETKAPDFSNDETWKKPQVAPPSKSVPIPEPPAVPKEATPQAKVAPDVSGDEEGPTDSQSQPSEQDTNTQSQALERIREIKALVNEKVGNPVNLVDINNEVGREYMSALLDAMKKLNSGSTAGSAMVRLEAAYASVEKTLEQQGGKTVAKVPVNEPIPAPAPVAPPAPVPVRSNPTPVETVERSELEMPVQPPVVEKVLPTPQPLPKPIAQAAPTPIPEYVKPVVQSEPAKEVSHSESETRSARVPIQNIETKVSHAAPEPVEIKSSRPNTTQHSTESASEWKHPAPSSGVSRPESESAPQQQPKPLSSLAESAPMKSVDSLPTKATEVENHTGDPLTSPQIDTGLEQLLEEWQIFKKSGLFGTGPKGVEHPLFKKMAPLQIPLLLAGRFEGATQEIKQSVTDYMNGWRYEQGLIYEQGETFEHYLRRVIKHILDLQKSKL